MRFISEMFWGRNDQLSPTSSCSLQSCDFGPLRRTRPRTHPNTSWLQLTNYHFAIKFGLFWQVRRIKRAGHVNLLTFSTTIRIENLQELKYLLDLLNATHLVTLTPSCVCVPPAPNLSCNNVKFRVNCLRRYDKHDTGYWSPYGSHRGSGISDMQFKFWMQRL